MSQPYFGQVWGWSPTLGKREDLESSGTPECLELDSKAQNTLHWGVLGVIGKFLKRRYRKWPRIGHLDICSPSYGQKKGRESNWQFDSRPIKVGNRPLSNVRIGIAIRRWKDLDEGYKFLFRPCCHQTLHSGVTSSQSPGTPPGTISGQFRDSNLGVPRKRVIWMLPLRSVTEYTIWGMVVASPESGPWWVLWFEVPVACPNTKGCPGRWTNHLGGLFWCRFKLDQLIPLPSLIPGLSTRPSTPF
jgi:hypothetical protein